VAEVYAWGDGQVLKLFHADLPERWVHREAEMTHIAHEAGLAAPAVGPIVEVDGRKGFVCERIDGETMLRTFATRPWRLTVLARQFAALHAAMHETECTDLPSQREGIAHTIQRTDLLADSTKERLLAALRDLPDGKTICHGDYHPDNILMSPRGPIVIDWLTTTRGDPLADVARTSLMVRSPALPAGTGRLEGWLFRLGRSAFHRAYLREYRTHRPAPKEQIAAWIPLQAAARTTEGIAAREKQWLVGLVQRWVGLQTALLL
jgi:uncharacterized protein (TIGR02172 family)